MAMETGKGAFLFFLWFLIPCPPWLPPLFILFLSFIFNFHFQNGSFWTFRPRFVFSLKFSYLSFLSFPSLSPFYFVALVHRYYLLLSVFIFVSHIHLSGILSELIILY